jgi:DNA polymerase elongation subunit (family B)
MDKLEKFGIEIGNRLEKFFSENFAEGIDMKLEKIFDKGIFGEVRKQYFCRTIYDEDSGWQLDEDGNLTWYEYTKGLPLVRSDRTKFLQKYQKATLNQILEDPEELRKMWTEIIDKYYNNEFDHLLIQRIGVKKQLDEYVNETPVIQAAKKLVERGEPFRPGEKVSFIVIDIDKNGKVAEPVNFEIDPKDAIKHLPKLTRDALDYYWDDRIWDNIEPFLGMVLDEDEIRKIKYIRTKETVFSQFPGFE